MTEGKDPSANATKILEKEGVRWVYVQFMDLVGRTRSVSFPAKHFSEPEGWARSITFDASSCGMGSVNSSDMRLQIDPSTILVYPWTQDSQKTARVIARIVTRDGEVSHFDSRAAAFKADARAKNMGFTSMELGPEMEFYLFHNMREAMMENDLWHPGVKRGIGTTALLPEILEEYGEAKYPPRAMSAYFLPASRDTTVEYRNTLCEQMDKMGVDIKYHHHEGGSRQVEVEFSPLGSSVETGEATSLFKYASRIVAREYGLLPTFMPKPLTGDAGSGMHVHIHLGKNGGSAFLDDDDDKLSQTGRYFVGGVLDHVREMSIVLNPIVNSYRRLVPGFEAPRYVVWGYSNRSSLIRVPPAKGAKMDVEIRNGDAAANPYLLLALVMEAGLEGVKKKEDPGDPVEENVDRLSQDEIRKRGIEQLPATLGEAISEAENSEFLERVLGKDPLHALLEYKRKEWQGYLGYATPWEIFHFFDV